MNTKNKNLMTTTQLAAALGVSYGTVARWKKKGCPYEETAPHVQLPVESRPKYDLDEVKAWYTERHTKLANAFNEAKTKATRSEQKEKLTPHKNISRVSNISFKGCKLSVQKFGFAFTRYFGVAQYKTWEEAEKAALEMRDRLRAALLGKTEGEVYNLLLAFRKGLAI